MSYVSYMNNVNYELCKLCELCKLHELYKLCKLYDLCKIILVRDYSFSTYAKCSEKLTFLSP